MRIIVIGAGKVGYTLAEHLITEEHDVIIIDKDDDVIQRCSGSLDALCIRGNGANAKILLEAGVDGIFHVLLKNRVKLIVVDDPFAGQPDDEAAVLGPLDVVDLKKVPEKDPVIVLTDALEGA